jgi:hypothetical protein
VPYSTGASEIFGRYIVSIKIIPKPIRKPLAAIILFDAWSDFIENQLTPFGDTPAFLTLGNHELIPVRQFGSTVFPSAPWLSPIAGSGRAGFLGPRHRRRHARRFAR